MSDDEIYKLLKELKDHLYGDQYGDKGDVPEIREHLKTMNGTVAELPCKKGLMFGCVPRKVFVKWLLLLVVVLSGGNVVVEQAINLALRMVNGG